MKWQSTPLLHSQLQECILLNIFFIQHGQRMCQNIGFIFSEVSEKNYVNGIRVAHRNVARLSFVCMKSKHLPLGGTECFIPKFYNIFLKFQF